MCRAVSDSSSPRNALDLYAKVEDLLGVKEASPALYAHYVLFLNDVDFDSILDVGCGSGNFLHQVKHIFGPGRVLGIDLSPLMVKQSIEKGVTAKCIDLCELDGSFDVVTAVFDMLNYLDKEHLSSLLRCLEDRVNTGGYFLCDINTLYGFEEIAVGSFIVDDEDRFVAIDSEFDDGIYRSEFTLFEKVSKENYNKSKETIQQYYHTAQLLRELLPDMELLVNDEVMLYGDDADKDFLVFQKRG